MTNENLEVLEDGASSTRSTPIRTIPDLLFRLGDRYQKPDAFQVKEHGRWRDVSTGDFQLHVEDLFFALRSLGVRPGDRVAIMSENRLEWAVADYAILCAGAITVPLYPTLSVRQLELIARDSEPCVLFVSTPASLEKVFAAWPSPCVRNIISLDPEMCQPGILRIGALLDIGRRSTYDCPGDFRRCAQEVSPEDVATIIYTSGTTGVPKGAMLTHRNLISNILATAEVLPLTPEDVELSFLPLSHVFQRHVDYAAVYAGATIAYAESLSAVPDNLLEVRPTFLAGVPRFFEKIHNRIQYEIGCSPRARQAIFRKAIEIGKEHVQTGRNSLAFRAADRVVYRKIREKLGGRIRWFICGGAALAREIAEFFYAIGLPIIEGYGLTETSPVITLTPPDAPRIGTVGRAVGDVRIKIAYDGEILVRGSNVMKGYYRKPHQTNEALRGGWFHTGDIGSVDADGYLRITDRKKDLIVMSTGKNVAPQPIENRLKVLPYFENVVVVGEGRSFVSALVVPNYTALEILARAHSIAFDGPGDLIRNGEIYKLVMQEVAHHTSEFADFEKVKKIAFLEKEFTIDGGELTPTMKVRRSVVEKKYRADIDHLYAA